MEPRKVLVDGAGENIQLPEPIDVSIDKTANKYVAQALQRLRDVCVEKDKDEFQSIPKIDANSIRSNMAGFTSLLSDVATISSLKAKQLTVSGVYQR